MKKYITRTKLKEMFGSALGISVSQLANRHSTGQRRMKEEGRIIETIHYEIDLLLERIEEQSKDTVVKGNSVSLWRDNLDEVTKKIKAYKERLNKSN